MVQSRLRQAGTARVHDLGCGTGSMARWLAARLGGPQRWFLYDQDPGLLDFAEKSSYVSRDNAPVEVRTRRADVALLDEAQLQGA
ncbi:MAG: class I SAM-dependent methyltransferase, partial [Actinomycetia bacterium]|nr:class I SAM-dependent methyltransferase [Actinomycetes bacterium]